MKYYILRRMALLIPTAWAVMTFVFVVVRILPGDPAVAMLGGNASEEALSALREQLGMNLPLWKQYVFFLRDVVNLEFGNSMITGTPVLGMTGRALGYTADLVVVSMVISILVGIPLGLLTAVKRNSWIDYTGRLFALLGLSVLFGEAKPLAGDRRGQRANGNEVGAPGSARTDVGSHRRRLHHPHDPLHAA
jgi:ABC-type dipeptide/oligopeptide/nickel transport system permease component